MALCHKCSHRTGNQHFLLVTGDSCNVTIWRSHSMSINVLWILVHFIVFRILHLERLQVISFIPGLVGNLPILIILCLGCLSGNLETSVIVQSFTGCPVSQILSINLLCKALLATTYLFLWVLINNWGDSSIYRLITFI